MVTDDMPFRRHPPHEGLVLLQEITVDKKCGLHPLFLQGIEDGSMAAVIKARIEGEGNLFFVLCAVAEHVIPRKIKFLGNLRSAVLLVGLKVPFIGLGRAEAAARTHHKKHGNDQQGDACKDRRFFEFSHIKRSFFYIVWNWEKNYTEFWQI